MLVWFNKYIHTYSWNELSCVGNRCQLHFLSFCVDVDECTTNMSVCMSDSQCVNTESFYRCDCNRGFEGNGFINCTSECIPTNAGSH